MRGVRARRATGLVLMPVVVLFLAMVGTNAFVKPNSSAAQYQYKVTICHNTGSESNPTVTLSVSASAVSTHVDRHGDALGPCPAGPTPSAATSANEDGGNGKGHGQGQGNGKAKDK